MIDLRPIAFVNGILLCVLAVAMLIPALIDAVIGHPDWFVFTVAAATTIFVGLTLIFTCRSTMTGFSLPDRWTRPCTQTSTVFRFFGPCANWSTTSRRRAPTAVCGR